MNIDHFGDRGATVWETAPPLVSLGIGLTLSRISVKFICFTGKEGKIYSGFVQVANLNSDVLNGTACVLVTAVFSFLI